MEPGTIVGRYTLLGKLASGGMAEVYLARQEGPEGFQKLVVVKCIHPQLAADEHFVKMFLNEARLAALLTHPNVVSIYELGRDERTGSYFMAMEWIEGANLKRIVHASMKEQKQWFPPRLAVRIIADACAGIEYAHGLKGMNGETLNLIHRDISPDNILVTYGGMVKVVDFGIAKVATEEGLTHTGQLKGKFGYMSPEQIQGTPMDRRTDVWALGVTLYWMLCGAKPFSAESEAELLTKIINEAPPPLGTRAPVPAPLVAVVMRALEKDVARRYPSARALQGDLQQWIQDSGTPVESLEISDYINELFPEGSDPDRASTRAILAGKVREGTNPTDVQRDRTTAPRLRQVVPKTVWAGAALVAVGGLAGGGWLARSRRAQSAPIPISMPSDGLRPAPEGSQLPPAAPAVGVAAPTAPPAVPEPAPPAREPSAKAKEASRQRDRRPHGKGVTTAPTSANAASAPVPSAASPGPPGTLDLRVIPWAVVFMDGRKLGTTPFEPLEVPSGHHTLRLVNDEINATKELKIDVKPGQTTPVRAKLE